MMQRDLWTVYDWVGMPRQGHDEARTELLKRLGEVIRRLALTEEQVRALPDNYQTAIQAEAFPPVADAEHRDAVFLPDLFNPDGPWVCIGQQQELPVASVHLEFFRGRSVFLVFLRLPEGRDAPLPSRAKKNSQQVGADAWLSAGFSGACKVSTAATVSGGDKRGAGAAGGPHE
jgi:hypothetical protein